MSATRCSWKLYSKSSNREDHQVEGEDFVGYKEADLFMNFVERFNKLQFQRGRGPHYLNVFLYCSWISQKAGVR